MVAPFLIFEMYPLIVLTAQFFIVYFLSVFVVYSARPKRREPPIGIRTA